MTDAGLSFFHGSGPIAVAAPHMDDEALGCGALLAALPDRRRVHVFFCGDGLGSFSARFVRSRGAEALKALRRREAAESLLALGLDPGNAFFFDGREWGFRASETALRAALHVWLNRTQPSVLLAPFRMDAHPDHLAVSRAARAWLKGHPRCDGFEYFVYHRLRLLPGGDMRRMVYPHLLFSTSPAAPHAAAKGKALRAYVSQATLFDPSWSAPVLSPALIAARSAEPECLVPTRRADEARGGGVRYALWTALVHAGEPRLKRGKDALRNRVQALLRPVAGHPRIPKPRSRA